MSPDETDVLIQKAVAGNDDATTKLLESYGPEVEQALSIGREWRSMLDPADVMQVTYLEAYLQVCRYDPDRSEPFPAWLRRIAENNLRDAIRALQRQKRPPPSGRIEPSQDSDSSSELFALLGVATTTPSRYVAREERIARLNAALDSLPDDYGRAVRLYDLDGLPIAEVARRMGRSGGAVHMLRARAHDRLREMLGSESGWFSSSA